jgi:hypothetical protein
MNAITTEWVRCRGYIEAALEHVDTHTIEDVEAGILAGLYVFWPASKSAAITEIQVFPRAKHMHIFLAGGDLDELRSMVPMWQSWARFNGCGKVTLCGRRGWERALKRQGWEADLVALSLCADREVEVSSTLREGIRR